MCRSTIWSSSGCARRPVRGNGDGGIYTTAADVHALWDALLAGAIASPETVAEMVHPRALVLWLYESTGAVSIHGFDAVAGFVSVRDPGGRFT